MSLSAPTASEGYSILYAPTTLAPGRSGFESVTVHIRTPTSGTNDAWGVWDWCRADPGWSYYLNMTSSWLDRYSSGTSDSTASTVIRKTSSSCWEVLLFDYKSGTYARLDTACGTGKVGNGTLRGWVMHETYDITESGCPTLPNIKATGINIGKFGGATNVSLTSSDAYWSRLSYGDCWGADNGWTFQTPASGFGSNSWQGLTN